MKLTHEEQRQIIADGLEHFLTTKEIGDKIGVTRQRVYQLMDMYGLQTPEKRRQGYWKKQSPQLKWLNRTLLSKGLPTEERIALLSLAETEEQFLPAVCPVLGIPLVYGNEGVRKDNSASIDRLDSSKGYVPGNVHVVCWRANRIKNDSTIEELELIVSYLKNKQQIDKKVLDN